MRVRALIRVNLVFCVSYFCISYHRTTWYFYTMRTHIFVRFYVDCFTVDIFARIFSWCASAGRQHKNSVQTIMQIGLIK